MKRFRGRPVLGAIAGFLLGISVALLLMSFSIAPLTTFNVLGLPLIGLVLGLLVAWFAPFGGRRDAVTGTEPESAA